jgi:leader peptidase (prepilin peptidase)/N-methyltransferase
MHVLSGLSGAALGLLAGPLVGRLALQLPADIPVWSAGWWGADPAARRRRVLITAVAAVVLGLLAGALGPQPALPAYLWLGVAGIALAVIDLDHHRLPDVLTLPTYGVGLVLLGVAAATDGDGTRYLRALLAMTVVFAAFFVLAFLGGVGFGDTKLAGVLGLYLGWIGWGTVLLGLVAGFVVGAAVAAVLLIRRLAGWRTDFAFGPALLLGALVAVVSGGPLIDAYVSGVAG